MSELSHCATFPTGKKIGTIFLSNHVNEAGTKTGKYEIGWQLLPAAWGQGFMTEAARVMIDVARAQKVGRVHAVVSEDNPRSLALCERLGLKKLGLTDDWYNTTLLEFVLDLE